MITHRVSHNRYKPYTIISNTVIRDNRISLKAKGLLLYVMSKPDDWVIRLTDIMKHCTERRDAIRNAIKELIRTNYVRKVTIRNNKGQIKKQEYWWYEEPQNPELLEYDDNLEFNSVDLRVST